MRPIEPAGTVSDSIVAGSLIASPAWVPWINSLNTLLTTLTLVLGIALAAARIWQIVTDQRGKAKSSKGERT